MKSLVNDFVQDIRNLCGHNIDRIHAVNVEAKLGPSFRKKKKTDRLSYRQLNEVLLLCNEGIVTEEFFRFLAGGKETISFGNFGQRVNEFRKLCMLQYGSFRFPFNFLRKKKDIHKEFGIWVKKSNKIKDEFKKRQKPIMEIEPIAEQYLPLLGFLTQGNDDPDLTQKVRKKGQRNFEAYLSYDYLDVYVATSMRQLWEYVEVNRLCKKVFSERRLKDLKVRYFDPTLSFHENSIAKGLIEGLMLKRAKCTLYLVQETDTMGKDSEMASTLAQGKPVVAYVPRINPKSRIRQLRDYSLDVLLQKADLLRGNVEVNELSRFMDCINSMARIKTESELDKKTQRRLLIRNKKEYDELIRMTAKYESVFYDKRADTLMNKHPLRFQIDLNSGVANGVLVCRNPRLCSKIIFGILTNSLKFEIIEPEKKINRAEKEADSLNYRLVEKSSNCAFRVVTKDEMLTNSFWNLYKREED